MNRFAKMLSTLYPTLLLDNDSLCVELNVLHTDSIISSLIIKEKVMDFAGMLKLLTSFKLCEALPLVFQSYSHCLNHFFHKHQILFVL